MCGRGLHNTAAGESDVSQLQILSANCQSDCNKYKNKAIVAHIVRRIRGGDITHCTVFGKAMYCCVSNISCLD